MKAIQHDKFYLQGAQKHLEGFVTWKPDIFIWGAIGVITLITLYFQVFIIDI